MLTASLLTSMALKSVVLAGIALGLLRVTQARTAAERSLIAHLGLLAIVIMPAASLVLPEWAPLPQQLFQQTSDSSQVLVPASNPPPTLAPTTNAPSMSVAQSSYGLPSLQQLAVWIYALPLIVIFGMMAVAVLRLFGMRHRAEVLVDGAWLSALAGAQRRMGFKHGTALLVSEELRSPISWGVLRPTILLDPRAVSAIGDAEAIIAHELAHVARLDWAKLLVARLACALFWFNPLVWLLARESHQLREEAADDSVLLTNIAGSDYATLLVNAARHDNSGVLIAAHGVAPGKTSLRRRVVRVLDSNVRRGPARGGWGAMGLIGVLAIAAPLAAFTTAATSTGHGVDSAGATRIDRISERTVGKKLNAADRPLGSNDGIAMSAVGSEPSDVARLRDRRGSVDPDTVIAAKATDMTPDYAGEMRGVFADADLDDLVGARAVGVDAAYARTMLSIDPRADLDTIIGARAVGVTAGYAQEIRRYFPRIDLDDLVSMRAVGVTSRDIEAMRASGIDVASPEDVVSVRAVMGRHAPPSAPGTRATVRAVRDGATAVAGPNGAFASRRNPDGTLSIAVTGPPPPGDDDR